MPIEVRHGPDFNLVGAAALAAGQGQYRQRQQEIDIQTALQIARQQEQQREANARMQLAQNQQVIDAQEKAAKFGLLAQNQGQDNLTAQQRADQLNAWREGQLKQKNEAMQLGQENVQNKQQNAWEVGGAQNVDAEVARRQAEIQKMQLDPGGTRVKADLLGKLRSIQTQRSKMRPGQYQSLVAQWLGEYDNANLQDRVMKPKTIDEVREGRVKDLGNGMSEIMQPDGRIDIKSNAPVQRQQKEAPAPKLTPAQIAQDPTLYYNVPGNAEKDRKDAIAAFANRETPPSEAEIKVEMDRIFTARKEFFRPHLAPPPAQSPAPPMTQGPLQTMENPQWESSTPLPMPATPRSGPESQWSPPPAAPSSPATMGTSSLLLPQFPMPAALFSKAATQQVPQQGASPPGWEWIDGKLVPVNQQDALTPRGHRSDPDIDIGNPKLVPRNLPAMIGKPSEQPAPYVAPGNKPHFEKAAKLYGTKFNAGQFAEDMQHAQFSGLKRGEQEGAKGFAEQIEKDVARMREIKGQYGKEKNGMMNAPPQIKQEYASLAEKIARYSN